MSYRRHAEVKPAAAPWIEEIPAHWDERPFYAVAKERRAKNTGMKEDNLLSLSYGNIVRKDINTPNGLLPESFETYQIVEPDDVVFRLTDLQNDKRSLRSAICPERGIITSAYLAVRSEGVLPGFMNYLMRAYDVQKVFYSMGGGMRQSLGFEDLRRMSVVAPNFDEQAAIVAFLDSETGLIDGLIEKKSRFIALLKEKRAAVITHAVTKGINPDAPMKDSGYPLIGLMPKHWIVAPVKVMFDNLDGKRVPLAGVDREHMAGDIPYYGASGIIDRINQHIFDEDLILVSEDGANLVSRVYRISFIARGKYWVNNHAHVIRPKDGCLDFWSERLEVVDLVPFITGSTQPKLTIENLLNIRVSMPPTVEERQAIQKHILELTPSIDSLITLTERSIDLLREKRAALITAAVTGKIDVRAAA
jgi:type I restriction enzyme S subunit